MARLTFLTTALVALASALLAQPRVIAVEMDDVIHPITTEILTHALEQAEEEDAAAVLLRLNTPGGLLDATREINERIVASPVPVIAYVSPSGGRAASAGFFILEAADVAAMAPGTNTGAASPVLLNGEMDDVMRQKVENDASAWLRSTVAKRGRNVELAIRTITEALAFTEQEALDGNLIDLIAPTEQRLLESLNATEVQRFDGRFQPLNLAGAIVETYELTWRERIMSAIANPNIGFILIIAGALGLYVEFNAPGLIVPGVAGGIALLLGLSSLSVLPINWIGVALLIFGLVLFGLEAHFSGGILGIGGGISMVFGAMILVDGPPQLQIGLGIALAVTVPFALITIFLLTIVLRAQANKAVTGTSGMLGEIGEVRTPLAPVGKIFIHGEYWNAEAEAFQAVGTKVRVVAVEGMKLRVSPLDPGSS